MIKRRTGSRPPQKGVTTSVITYTFHRDKPSPHFVRYQRPHPVAGRPWVIYIPKTDLEQLGDPPTIQISFTTHDPEDPG